MSGCNSIITRGLACPKNRLITQGYGGPIRVVPEAVRIFIKGHGGDRRRQEDEEEIIIWAKLIEYNGEVPKRKIDGFVRVPVDRSRVSVVVDKVSQRIRETWEDVTVTVKRLK